MPENHIFTSFPMVCSELAETHTAVSHKVVAPDYELLVGGVIITLSLVEFA